MKQLLKVHTFILIFLTSIGIAHAAPENALDQDARAALNALYESSPAAKALGEKAKGILVFPDIRKAAFIIGAQSGQGAMFANGKITGHYRADGVLAGLEAGAQSFAYVMFFMSDKALQNLRSTRGFEIGADPNIVIVDAGAAKEISTSTTQADVYGYVFNQKGLMGGIALQGLKITKVQG
jgi:lipid-binding SYLF domain-containing protein